MLLFHVDHTPIRKPPSLVVVTDGASAFVPVPVWPSWRQWD